ncbi:MAG TPA: threonine synthase, partial [Alphaproteobacteria bacterium]|nr:threonine synthase [Alphaproteobacteria bacterium]
MQYISTRGQDAPISFADALLAGLARDGGLYLPTEWPQFADGELMAMASMPYAEVAARIMAKFTGDDLSFDELLGISQNAYATFSADEVTPLTRINDQIHLCELYHGPTIAFKDVAMQVLSRLFDYELKKRGSKAVILGATSGDTGSAALEAFRGRNMVDIFILYPDGRVSPVQEQQMTSVIADGAHAVAVAGDFDDCQAIVKSLFGDLAFRDHVGLSAINSINWARLMPQIVYYVTSVLALGGLEKPISFAVPTGNFGNIFAGYAAMKMGLPIKQFICASNCNDILTRFFDTGVMERRMVEPSLSPSMDIQVSSNFERLLFELLGRDGAKTAAVMQNFAASGHFTLDANVMERAYALFTAYRLDDAGTVAEIATTAKNDGMILDPHSAVGLSAARRAHADGTVPKDVPII